MNKADKLTAKFWDKLRRAAGVEIVYVRDDISRPLRIIREEASPQGMIVLASVKHFKEVRTYLIVAAELPFLPSVGDVILDGARRYEIFAGASEPVYEYTDASCLAYTVNAFARREEDEE